MRQSILMSDYACIAVNDNSTAMEIPLVDSWLKVGVFTKNKPNRVSQSDQANNRIIIGANGDYDIDLHVSLSAAGANKIFEITAFEIALASSAITGATAADPVVVTALAHGFSDGDLVKIADVGGMVELNNRIFIVADKTDDTFELQDDGANDIDGGGFTAYTTGGTAHLAVLESDVHAHRKFVVASDVGMGGGGSIEALSVGNHLELYMKNVTDATNMTTEALTLKMKRVG